MAQLDPTYSHITRSESNSLSEGGAESCLFRVTLLCACPCETKLDTISTAHFDLRFIVPMRFPSSRAGLCWSCR